MMRTFTGCEGYGTAVLSMALLLGAPATSWADDGDAGQVMDTSPVTAGAWSIEAGQARVRTSSDRRVVELADARLSLPGQGDWLLVADRLVLTYDVLDQIDSIGAHGEVRVVGQPGGEVAAGTAYAVGQHAWIDPSGVRGLVLGSDVALLRAGWQIRASHMDIEFTVSRLALRGVESGPVRARRDEQ